MDSGVYVYLIEAIIDNITQYKIGISKKPERRILELKTGNPNITCVIDKYLCDNRLMAHKIESWYHKYHYNKNIDGEWFLLNEEDIYEFIELCERFEVLVKTHLELEEKIKEQDIKNRLWK